MFLNAEASTQRNGFKVEVPSLKVGTSEVQGEALFRVNKSETPIATVNIDAAKIDLGDFRAAPAAPPQAAPAQPASPVQRRFIPSAPLSVNWLGRSTLSVNARVGEVVGLSGKIQNGSVTLTSSEKRFAFRAAATVGSGSAGFDLVFDPAGRVGQNDSDGIGQSRVVRGPLGYPGPQARPARCRGRHRSAFAR